MSEGSYTRYISKWQSKMSLGYHQVTFQVVEQNVMPGIITGVPELYTVHVGWLSGQWDKGASQ